MRVIFEVSVIFILVMKSLILLPLFLILKHGGFKLCLVMMRSMRMNNGCIFKQGFNSTTIVIFTSAIIVNYQTGSSAIPIVPCPR